MREVRCVVCETVCSEEQVIYINSNHPVCTNCAGKLNTYLRLQGGVVMESIVPVDLTTQAAEKKLIQPMEIKKLLDEYVVGQENAKKVLAVAAYNHYKRIELGDSGIKKSNILLVGPTGCGKTYLVQRLAEILQVPLAIAPATNLTEAGYVGNDAESVVQKLLQRAGGNVEKAEKGIIFIDEIDKLSPSNGSKKEVGGVGVQQALLPIIEGTNVDVAIPESSHGIVGQNQAKVTVDTSNILFVCGGAFPDAEKIIRRRMGNYGAQIGFTTDARGEVEEPRDDSNLLQYVTTDDLREFGMIPEFLGRVPVIATLKSLDVDTLRQILYLPKDSLVGQYRKLFSFDNIELEFTEEALTAVAEKAFAVGTGARSLRTIMENLLLDIMYEAPSDNSIKCLRITREFVEGTEKVLINSHSPMMLSDEKGHVVL